jgi:hypothetical protein
MPSRPPFLSQLVDVRLTSRLEDGALAVGMSGPGCSLHPPPPFQPTHYDSHHAPSPLISFQLVDMRFAARLEDGPLAVDTCGAGMYLAPEQVAQLGHGMPADFWQLGVLIYQMTTGSVRASRALCHALRCAPAWCRVGRWVYGDG